MVGNEILNIIDVVWIQMLRSHALTITLASPPHDVSCNLNRNLNLQSKPGAGSYTSPYPGSTLVTPP